MNTLRAAALIVICTQFALTSLAQTSLPLSSRIPKADPKKYEAIRDGLDWKNPKIFVRPEGIEIIGITPPAKGTPAESIPKLLEQLPDSAWPYGLVVAVWNIDILTSRDDSPKIQSNRTKLLKILKQYGIAVWP